MVKHRSHHSHCTRNRPPGRCRHPKSPKQRLRAGRTVSADSSKGAESASATALPVEIEVIALTNS